MATDWVPLFNYNTRLSLPAGTSNVFPLMDPGAYDSATEQLIGAVDESPKRLKWLRIVGQFDLRFDSAWTGAQQASFTGEVPAVKLAVWPGLVDSTAVVRQAGNPTAPDAMNQRVWWHYYRQPRLFTDPPFIDFTHPWWTTLDIAPKQWTDVPMIPVLSIVNPFFTASGEQPDVEFIHWWRAYVAFS